MGVHDDLFPTRQNLDYVQTQWSGGWQMNELGFARAAGFLTEHRRHFGAAIDSVGLAIFFLQRHRVELAMKGLLAWLGERPPTHHRLDALWTACQKSLEPHDAEAWTEFAGGYRELVFALHKVDSGSFAFRYPSDLQGDDVERPAYIDLDAVERHISGFTTAIDGYIAWIDEGRRWS